MGSCLRGLLPASCLLVWACSSSSAPRTVRPDDAATDGKRVHDAGHDVDGARVDARHAADGARVDAHDAGHKTDGARVDARRSTDGARDDAGHATDGARPDARDARVDVSHPTDGAAGDARDAARPPVFTLDAGTTWSSLYRDYFGPAGVASCAGAAAGDCHGSTTQLGYEGSDFLCPTGDASAACYAGFKSAGANLLDPDASFADDPVSDVLCQAGAVGTMPLGCPYVFTPVDIERISDWVNAGAPDN